VGFYAFDMLAGDTDDHGKLPLPMRKTNLARPVARRADASLSRHSSTARSVPACSVQASRARLTRRPVRLWVKASL
jgi:ATP-dependent DNA ligase